MQAERDALLMETVGEWKIPDESPTTATGASPKQFAVASRHASGRHHG